MSSKKELLNFVIDGLENVSYKPMMGEFLLYFKGKIVGGIYDDRLLVKNTNSTKNLIKNAKFEPPYTGAKEMILVENLENKEFLMKLFDEIYNELYEKEKK